MNKNEHSDADKNRDHERTHIDAPRKSQRNRRVISVPRPDDERRGTDEEDATTSIPHMTDTQEKPVRQARHARKRNRHDKNERKHAAAKEAKDAISKFKVDVSAGDRNATGIKRVIKALFGFIALIIKLICILFRGIWHLFVYIAVSTIALVVICALGVGALYVSTSGSLPDIEDYTRISMPQDATIYDVDGNVIGVVSTSNREPVSFSEIAQPAKDAIVSIEDERFYNHEGIDVIGICRSLYVNFVSWSKGGSSTSQGASTITQQYVRNAYKDVGNEQTISRKLTEMMLSIELESSMSKDDILSSYLNTVYYGNGCYGIEVASKFYFGHDASSLDYYESAILASVVNSPTYYNPTTDDGKKHTAERVDLVLDKMWSLGKLGSTSEDELRAMKQTDINSVLHITKQTRTINQPYYYDYVMSDLLGTYTQEDIESGGWQIYTTLSIKDGNEATDLVSGIEDKYGDTGTTSAIVDINVGDGSINAFCGGTDYATSQYNAATTGRLQSGSTLKPFLYATLLEKQGYYTTDKFDHSSVDVSGDDETQHIITSYISSGGDSSIKNGIIQSDNAMAIHAAQQAGMDNVNTMMHACGFTNDIEDNAIAIIGGQTYGFTPLEMATGYATIANGGQKRSTWCVKSISDSLGNEIYKHQDDSSYAMSKEVASQLTDAMTSAVDERKDWYDIPFDHNGGWTIAAKSGTTDEKADLWCCGFDTQHAVSVWIGGRDARVESPTSTPTACHELSDYFYATHQDDPKESFASPQFKTTVPTLSDGQSLDDYVSVLSERQLKAKMKYVNPSGEQENGDIVSIDGQGELVDRNSSVTITVARDKITVPNFISMSPSDAYDAAAGLNLTFTTQYVTSGSSSPTITAQSVDAGDVVDKGTSVNITVQLLAPSTDTQTTQVPYKGSDTAMSALEAERDRLKTDNDSKSSQITSLQQQLADALSSGSSASSSSNTNTSGSGSNSTSGSGTSSGSKKVTVPDVSNMSVDAARTKLKALGLEVTVSGASSSADIVSYTIPAANTSVDSGSSVTLIVAP